jgi:hypothetical protein
MTTFPSLPRMINGSIVLIDSKTSVVQRAVPLHLDSSLEKLMEFPERGVQNE